MPSIVIPRRQLVQPQGYARVADGSWMTYLPSAGINSLLDGRGLSNSGVALALGNSGIAADIDAAADYLEYTPAKNIPDSFHLVAVVDLNASSTFSRLIQSGDSSGYERFLIWFAPSTSSGSVGNPNSVVIGRNISPSILGERWSTAANSLVRPRSGVVLEVIWGATASDTTAPQVWINGVEQTVTKVQSSASFNADFDTLSGAPLRIGNRFGSVDRGLLGKLYLLHVEQQSRIAPYINPWQLFGPSPRRLYFDVPAGTVTVQADGTIRWSLVSSVQAAQALRWSLSAAVQRDTSLLWSLLKSVQSDITARWSLIQAINADAALRWNLVRAVQGDAALSWALLSAVSADSALAWNLAGALGVVSSELALRWSALAPVSVSADLHWHLLNAVAHDIALPWNAVQAIAADGALRWALVQALQADLTAAWRMVTAVSADSVLAWDLAAAIGIVATSLDLRWSLIARVQQAIEARWSLLASVGADADMRWDIVAGVVRELILRWDSVATLIADNTLDLSWSLIAVSETDLLIRWQVGEVFDLVVRKRFVAGAATRRIFTAGASTCRSFVA